MFFFGRSRSHAFAFTIAVPSSLSVRRSVRSTSAASRKDAECAGHKVQVPKLASKAFLNLKSLALKTYPKASLKGRLEKLRLRQASPHPKVLPPRPAHTAKNPGKKFLGPFFSIFGPSKWQSKFGFEKITKKVQNSRI